LFAVCVAVSRVGPRPSLPRCTLLGTAFPLCLLSVVAVSRVGPRPSLPRCTLLSTAFLVCCLCGCLVWLGSHLLDAHCDADAGGTTFQVLVVLPVVAVSGVADPPALESCCLQTLFLSSLYTGTTCCWLAACGRIRWLSTFTRCLHCLVEMSGLFMDHGS